MTISTDDIIQTNVGTGLTASLPNATVDGNTVIVCCFSHGTGAAISTFTRDHGPTGSTPKAYVLRKSDVTGGENSWTITGPTAPVWIAMELRGLHVTAPKDTNVSVAQAASATTTFTSGTTPQTTTYEGLALYFWGAHNATNNTIPVLSAPTNDAEIFLTASRQDASTAAAVAVGTRVLYDTTTVESTITSSVTANGGGAVVVYAPIGAKRVPNLDLMFGAEMGTTAGWTTGNAGNAPIDVVNGNVTVSSTTPRTGSYCLRLTGSSAAANVAWTTTGALNVYPQPTGYINFLQYVARLSFRFVGSLPAADCGVACIDEGSETLSTSSGLQIFYRAASGTLEARMRNGFAGTTGTPVVCTVPLVADQWHSLEMYVDMANPTRSATFLGLWRVDGVEQTTATVATSAAGSTEAFTQFRIGWQGSITATMDVDDVAGSKHPANHPMGDIKIYPLTVDPAATPTVTNAAAFSTFTNNGTINSTFSTTTARNAVDDLPPTIGASADGFVQDAIGASDYVELAMGTRAVATNLEGIRGLRWYFPGWAVSNLAATIGFRAYDGTTETTLFAAADPNFDNSTTTPAWVCRMHKTEGSAAPYLWTQTLLDNLAARVGFSGDADPDIGVHAVFAELAVVAAVQLQVVEFDGVLIYALLDPDSSNVIAMRLVAPADGDAWATYRVNGSDVNRTALAGGEDLYVIGAESNQVVSSWTGGRS